VQRGHWLVATLVGIVVASALAAAPSAWPALAIGGGAIAAAVVHGVGTAPRKRYALLGTGYCLCLAAIARLAVLPTFSTGSPWRALLTVGVASGLVVAIGLFVRRSIDELAEALVPGGDARSTATSVRHGVKLFGTLRTAIAVGGTLARLAGVVAVGVVATLLLGVLTFLLNAAGVSAPIPWLGGAVDAVVLAFVLAVAVGFYVLAATRAIYVAATTGVTAGRAARSRVAAARENGTTDEGAE